MSKLLKCMQCSILLCGFYFFNSKHLFLLGIFNKPKHYVYT